MYKPPIEIYEAFKKGDQYAFSQIYNDLYKFVYRYIEKRLDGFKIDKAYDVNDIVSTVFTSLWTSRERLQDLEHPYHFVFTVALREMLHLTRSKKNRDKREKEIVKASDLFSEQPHMRFDAISELMPFINELPKRRKDVIKMYIDGKTTSDIELELGIDGQTILNHKTRGIIKLRTLKNNIF